nr:M28 family peptidase [Bacteroidales bacterium]
VLLLLAEMLRDYRGSHRVELVAFNGEDYYAVPGQMKYIEENYGKFGDMLLNINIDGAGYYRGPSAFSLFSLPPDIEEKARRIIEKYTGLEEGIQWPQGDHSIFLQSGVPAIAVSSEWFINNIETQEITHTPKDNTEITDCGKLIEIASALHELINDLSK